MEQHHEVPNLDQKLAAFARAIGVMQTLRKDCPWDAKQTNESIRQNSIEEVYEPYLLQAGLIQRTPRGRKVSPEGYRCLGLDTPNQNRQKTLF